MVNAKEKKTEKMSFRTTPSGKQTLEQEAQSLNLKMSELIESKVLDNQPLKNAFRKVMCVSLVEVGSHIDEILNLCDSTDSDCIAKADLLPILMEAKKGVEKIYGIK